MGYKLAGCNVLGCVEIDPKMNEVYVRNHHPKFNYCMDVREFNEIPNEELPPELFNLDILDGSPPCTTFSMAGDREESWGKKKKFHEGQKEQTLDDLSFVFINTVEKLKPKVVIMENVEGLLLGEAWSYVQEIYKRLNAAGYVVNHWLCKGENMGVPQTRHRVFFVAIRANLDVDPHYLGMSFDYEPVTYEMCKEGEGIPMAPDKLFGQIARQAIDTDQCIADTNERLGGKLSGFQSYYARPNKVLRTIRAKDDHIDLESFGYITKETIRNAATFPRDYDFGSDVRGVWTYICGRSVPPVMMKRVVQRLIEPGVFDYKRREAKT